MKKVLTFTLFFFLKLSLSAQNITITPNGITPASNSSYQRLSYDQIIALTGMQEGDLAYDLTFHCLRIYNNNKWLSLSQQTANEPNLKMDTYGTDSFSKFSSIEIDSLKNIYLCGYFNGNIQFGTNILDSENTYDAFIVKMDASGLVLWIKHLKSTLGNEEIWDMKIDSNLNVYVTGKYSNTVDFGNGISKNSSGGSDIFIAKYTTNGILQWVKSDGGPQDDVGKGLVLDVNDNVYVTGEYMDTATFGSNITTRTSSGNSDVFLIKYNTNGIFQWVKSEGGTGSDYSNAITIDINNNIYYTGTFTSTANFGTNTFNSAGSYDIFVIAFSSTSSFLWSIAIGGTGYEVPFDIECDFKSTDPIHLVGQFEGTVQFSNNYTKASIGKRDGFFLRINTTGYVQYVTQLGSVEDDAITSIKIDNSGNYAKYISGYYGADAIFDKISLKNNSFSSKSSFFARLMGNYYYATNLKWITTIPKYFYTNTINFQSEDIYFVGNIELVDNSGSSIFTDYKAALINVIEP
ncbi:MAG: hypothetical protein U0V04_16545 [Spirosomataceae bacterium]|jgi:hypothetical protein